MFHPIDVEDYSLCPRLHGYALPREEELDIRLAQSTISDIQDFIKSFAAAVELCAFAARAAQTKRQEHKAMPADQQNALDADFRYHMGVAQSWSQIAARGAAMNVFDIHEAMNTAMKTLARVTSVKSFIDFGAMRKARKKLEADFPGFEALRNLLAHPGTRNATAKAQDKNSHKRKYESQIISKEAGSSLQFTAFEGNRFTATVRGGHIYSVEISHEATQKLLSSLKMFVAPLVPLTEELERLCFAFHRAKNAIPDTD